MSVYHPFEGDDLQHTNLSTAPRFIGASGTLGAGGAVVGWRSNYGVSSSLSLYEGVRSRSDVGPASTSGLQIFPVDFVPVTSPDAGIFYSGSYPATGSITFVKVRTNLPQAQLVFGAGNPVTSQDWYREHWGPIERLYDYYNFVKPDLYFTGSYDYYSLNLRQALPGLAEAVWFSGSSAPLGSAFTVECWVKPTTVTGSRNFTVQSQSGSWKFYITSSGLGFSDYATTLLSNTPVLNVGEWNHVAFIAGGGSGTFYVNLSQAGTSAYTGTLSNVGNGSLIVGAEMVSGSAFNDGLNGLVFESKVWNIALSVVQLSSSYNRALTGSASGNMNLLHYARFNDGPLSTAHGFVSGSGAFDYSPQAVHGQFKNVRTVLPLTPEWEPNDNVTFMPPKTKILNSAGIFRVLHVPSMFYGRSIVTGSLQLVCNAYSNQGFQRVLVDDGMGGVYLSGSLLKTISGEDYAGCKWRKVGNIFYDEGLVVITDPCLLDFADNAQDWSGTPDLLQASFLGSTLTQVMMFNCALGQTEVNASNNPTYVTTQYSQASTPKLLVNDLGLDGGPVTYITAIGIYNENHELVSIAKLAQPIRKREKDKITIRLRLDIS